MQEPAKISNNSDILDVQDGTLIECYCSVGLMGMETKFLIDTDAEVSLIQIDKIRDDIYVKNEDKCELRGRSVGSLLTFGTCAADLIFKNKIMHHKFHLVRENISGKYDGILGQDFLRKYALQIKFFEEKPSQFVFM